jgi:hypothetical protein
MNHPLNNEYILRKIYLRKVDGAIENFHVVGNSKMAARGRKQKASLL